MTSTVWETRTNWRCSKKNKFSIITSDMWNITKRNPLPTVHDKGRGRAAEWIDVSEAWQTRTFHTLYFAHFQKWKWRKYEVKSCLPLIVKKLLMRQNQANWQQTVESKSAIATTTLAGINGSISATVQCCWGWRRLFSTDISWTLSYHSPRIFTVHVEHTRTHVHTY